MANENTTLVPFKPPTLAEMQEGFSALVALKSMMRRGIDFGTIPGCGDKPTLFKPGAEKVLKRFMVHVVDIQVEDLSTADCIRYRVRCVGQTPDGITRGVGIGECSTDEEKYKWRKARNRPEWDDTPDARRREKHMSGRNGDYIVNQVRTNPADAANTVLKMGKKRSMVDLALTATAASDFFTQDVEDMTPEMQAQVQAEHRRQRDPHAPPVVDTTGEVVDPEPPVTDSRRMVWERAKELGLQGEDVKEVIAALTVPGDPEQWSLRDVATICDELTAQAADQGGHHDYDGPEPPPVGDQDA